jgi:hypothetical protein
MVMEPFANPQLAFVGIAESIKSSVGSVIITDAVPVQPSASVTTTL